MIIQRVLSRRRTVAARSCLKVLCISFGVLAFALGAASAASAASFDCSKAQYPLEKLICADKELSHWDGQVGKVYKQARSIADAQGKKQHRSEQRAFLKQRYDKCNVPRRGEMPFDQALRARTCLVDLYKERNAKLSMILLKKQKSERQDAAVNDDLKPPMGKLVISDVRWSGMTALTDEEARQHFGEVMDVREYHLFSPFHDGDKCHLKAPEILSIEDFEYKYRARRTDLGIERQSIIDYEYDCGGSYASILVANDGDLILSPWDGGYFVLQAAKEEQLMAKAQIQGAATQRELDKGTRKRAEAERRKREQTIAAREEARRRQEEERRLASADALAEGRWQALENNPSCSVWDRFSNSNVTVTWSGACANGKAQGGGTQVWRILVDGEWKTEKYVGEMKDGKPHGRGVAVTAAGARYEGDWRDGQEHGRGVLAFASGDRYEGEWKDGEAHGRGVFVGAGGRYEGDWRDSMKHGRGVFVWADGSRYEGGFKDNTMHGRGVLVWANGDRYEGEWKDGARHGRGVMVEANGDRYEGEWKDGKKHAIEKYEDTEGQLAEARMTQQGIDTIVINSLNGTYTANTSFSVMLQMCSSLTGSRDFSKADAIIDTARKVVRLAAQRTSFVDARKYRAESSYVEHTMRKHRDTVKRMVVNRELQSKCTKPEFIESLRGFQRNTLIMYLDHLRAIQNY